MWNKLFMKCSVMCNKTIAAFISCLMTIYSKMFSCTPTIIVQYGMDKGFICLIQYNLNYPSYIYSSLYWMTNHPQFLSKCCKFQSDCWLQHLTLNNDIIESMRCHYTNKLKRMVGTNTCMLFRPTQAYLYLWLYAVL